MLSDQNKPSHTICDNASLYPVLFAFCSISLVIMSYFGTLSRTKSGIEHVKGHLVTLRSPCDSHQTLVAIILRLIDLDDTSTELPDFVDLRASFSDDCANHVIGYKDLLCERLTWHQSLDGLLGRTSMAMRGRMTAMRLRLVGSSSSITMLRRVCVVHRRLGLLLRWLAMQIRYTIRVRRCSLWLVVVSPIIIRVTVLTAGGLRHIWHDLHPSRNNTSWAAATCGVCRSCGTAESLCQLLHKSLSNVVCGNVDCVCYSKNDQGSLSRKRKA